VCSSDLELGEMRERINGLRGQLAAAHPAFAPLASQRGMFATLPLSPEAVLSLKEGHGVYMTLSGRINIAGLGTETVSRFAELAVPLLGRS
jgi:aromatic-amino-acid transaminase